MIDVLTIPLTILDHEWIKGRLDEMLNLPSDPDLTIDDLVAAASLDFSDLKDRLEAYYPDKIRRRRAVDVFDYTEGIIVRVAPLTLNTTTLEMLLDLEWLAHMRLNPPIDGRSPKLYRDHVLHPAYVCAIGWWMLSDSGPDPLRCPKIACLLENRYGDLAGGLNWNDIARRAWILASLNHDLLYPIEFLETIGGDDSVKKHTCWGKRLYRSSIRQIYNSTRMGIFQGQISYTKLERLIRESKRSHAPLSALHLIGPESGYADASDRRKIIHELAASAVIHHHSDDPKEIDYIKRPLGYLLSLADECHEFGREMTVWSDHSEGFKVEFIPPILSSEIIQVGDDFTIIFHMNEPDKITQLESGGFDGTKYVSGKEKGFNRLNPVDSSGDYIYGFSFKPRTRTS